MPQKDPPEAKVQKAGIVVDDWKLPTFRKRLKKAGFDFVEVGPFTKGTTVLTIETADVLRLKGVLERCHSECARKRP